SRDEHVVLRVPGELLRGVPHPGGERRRVVDDDVERAPRRRGDVAVQIADELFHASLEEVGTSLVAIEQRHAMSARGSVLALLRSGETRAAEDEDVERGGGAPGARGGRSRLGGRRLSECERGKTGQTDGATGGGDRLDEGAASGRHPVHPE